MSKLKSNLFKHQLYINQWINSLEFIVIYHINCGEIWILYTQDGVRALILYIFLDFIQRPSRYYQASLRLHTSACRLGVVGSQGDVTDRHCQADLLTERQTMARRLPSPLQGKGAIPGKENTTCRRARSAPTAEVRDTTKTDNCGVEDSVPEQEDQPGSFCRKWASGINKLAPSIPEPY